MPVGSSSLSIQRWEDEGCYLTLTPCHLPYQPRRTLPRVPARLASPPFPFNRPFSVHNQVAAHSNGGDRLPAAPLRALECRAITHIRS